MRILFDQGIPVPLREHMNSHQVETAFERGWSTLTKGELLARATIPYYQLKSNWLKTFLDTLDEGAG